MNNTTTIVARSTRLALEAITLRNRECRQASVKHVKQPPILVRASILTSSRLTASTGRTENGLRIWYDMKSLSCNDYTNLK